MTSTTQSESGVVVTTHTAADCSSSLIEACAALMWATPEFSWAHNAKDGKVDRHPDETVARMMAEVGAPDDELQARLQWHTVMQGGELFASAKTFVRVITHSDGVRMPVLALGNVACARSARGKGFGRAVVETALGRLQDQDLVQEGVIHCLFETAIPAFYERLGARRLAKDLVVNSTGNQVAFEDDFVMVFPETKPWPEGTIDLQGPGY